MSSAPTNNDLQTGGGQDKSYFGLKKKSIFLQ
jgi:hypothetical protein